MDKGAVLVPKNLHFDMAWAFDIPFEIDRAFSKSGDRFTFRRRDRFEQVFLLPNNTHAFSAATRGRFDEERVAKFAYLFAEDGGIT
jgi:hypothetical protein